MLRRAGNMLRTLLQQHRPDTLFSGRLQGHFRTLQAREILLSTALIMQ